MLKNKVESKGERGEFSQILYEAFGDESDEDSRSDSGIEVVAEVEQNPPEVVDIADSTTDGEIDADSVL